MAKQYRIYQVDAFTRERFTGNAAGVVPNADGLSALQMQSLARELNNSETAFVLQPDGNDHDLRIRFFTPTMEVPSCGHATVAAHYVLAVEKNLDSTIRVHHKIGIGVLPVDIVKIDNDYQVHMTQGEPQFLNTVEGTHQRALLSALGLDSEDLDTRAPMQIVSTGHSKVMVGLRTRDRLNALKPNFTALDRLSQQIGSNGYFVFTLDSEEPDILAHARMFAPAIGINEDPVTGNGNGPLGALLVQYELVNHNGKTLKFKSKQGEAMGRPGIAHVEVESEEDRPQAVRVGGEAVIAFESALEL